jgi:uncharacterized protein
MKQYILLLFSITCIFSVQGYPVTVVPNPKTTDASNFVSNPDGILDSESVSQINAVLQSLESEIHTEIAVVVLQSIGDDVIEDFAVRLFQKWGIGKKGLDNGLLILFVLDQRAVRFETGYGLEGVLPDAICKRVQTQVMIPAFKNGNYSGGILSGIEKVAALIREEPVPELQEESFLPILSEILLPALMAYLFLILASFVWIYISVIDIRKSTGLQTNLDRYLVLKSKKKIVKNIIVIALPLIGFVVLSFLNTGYIFFLIPIPFTVVPANLFAKAQMKKFRYQPMSCDTCATMMRLLSENEDNAYLNPSQNTEEKNRSVDYDVFLCDKCNKTVVFKYDGDNLTYKKCPKCNTKAFKETNSYTIKYPTSHSTGIKRAVYVCQFCHHTENRNEILPRLSSRSRGSSSFNSRLGGGSFGGGRSGGGGSTSRW